MLCAFVVRAVLALFCVVLVCGACIRGGRGGVCCVRAGVCVWCACGAFGCLPSPLCAWVGGSVWVSGLRVVVPRLPWLRGLGVVPCHAWLGFGGGSVFLRRPLCLPSPRFLLAALPGVLFPWCLVRDYPGCGGCAVALGGGVLDAGSGPFPWCFLLGGPMLALPVRVLLGCTGRPFVPAPYKWTCSVARYSSRSPHRGPVHCGSQGSPCGTGTSLACPDGRCALAAAPRWARTAVRAVGSAPGQAHWSPPQPAATSGC